MAWTAPKTFTPNSVLSAAELNTYLRDNLLETVPAKATTPGSIFVATGLNAIAERIVTSDYVATSEGTASTSYVDVATVGPSVTVTTSVQVLVFLYCQLSNSGANASLMSYAVSGATTNAANDDRCIDMKFTGGQRVGNAIFQTGLTAGANTFTAKYRAVAGTATFATRRIAVIPF